MSPSLQDYMLITQLLNNMALAEDTLDWRLFADCWTKSQPLQIDLSSHLSQFSSDLQLSPAELCKTSHKHLAGFDGTQHIVSNVIVDYDNDTTSTATARAYSTAYHEFKRPAEEGPNATTTRSLWTVKCVRESDGVWRAWGIKVAGMVTKSGDPTLYDVAEAKALRGEGREMLTSWE